jgi:hypothetical protein
MHVYFTHNYRGSVYQLHVVDDDELKGKKFVVKDNYVYLGEYDTKGYKYLVTADPDFIYNINFEGSPVILTNDDPQKVIKKVFLSTAEEYYEKELENGYSDESPELVDYNFAKPNEKLSQDILYYSKHEAFDIEPFVHVVNTDYKYPKNHREWELPHHLDECVSVVYYKSLN